MIQKQGDINVSTDWRRELNKTQTKLNEAEEEIIISKDQIEYLKSEINTEHEQDTVIGCLMLAGVLAINFIAPIFVGSRILSTNFSPKIGPVDIVVILISLAFIWKGIKK